MSDFEKNPIVSTAWLAENMSAPDLRIVDATYYLPHEGLEGRREFEAAHIPGAVFFDIDEWAAPGDL
jgi:thiosulfate/3-mercaptopyruvate sulfurtransferase